MNRWLWTGTKPSEVSDMIGETIKIGDYVLHFTAYSTSIAPKVYEAIGILDKNRNGDPYITWGGTNYVKLHCLPVKTRLDGTYFRQKPVYLEDSEKVLKLSGDQLKRLGIK